MPILNWLNREQDVRSGHKVPYRLLEEVPEFSAGVEDTSNLVIQGDNLEALKALLPFYAGRVKCVYIDPPYNTRSAFEHYDDNLEHAKWLSMMWPRLEILRNLLAEDGSIWVSIDDNEGHYLKVIMDEVFGRGNFAANVVWKSSDNSNNDARQFSLDHNHILVYSKMPTWITAKLRGDETKQRHFKNPDDDPRGPWFDGNPLGSPALRENLVYDLVSPQGHIVKPPANGWRWSKETLDEKLATGEIRFSSDGKSIKRRTYLRELKGLPPSSLWIEIEETGHNRQAKFEQKRLFPAWAKSQWFGTPKPEKLLKRVLELSTLPGDIVLDSFLGSGTTAAVAHKMGRRYIGIEMGDHAVTHCVPRLRKVIEGERGGISEAVGWTGGGGFRFYRLGPPAFDPAGHIRADIKFPILAAHVWFSETGTPWRAKGKSPLLGIHNGRAYALLYNGILGDKRPEHGNVLTRATLDIVKEKISKKDPAFGGSIVVYGEMSRLAPSTLERLGIEFKQMPYDVKARA